MLLIHTADIHIDSRLNSYFDKTKAAERRNEILINFQNMVQYGADHGVRGIIIAGDLFDVRNISAIARDAVYASVFSNPEIEFYYIAGNHDSDSFIKQVTEKYGKVPDNLKLFDDFWVSYSLYDPQTGVEAVITGAELTKENNHRLADSLNLDADKLNIVILHWQEREHQSRHDAEIIPLRDYRGRGIDYLALGHVHEVKYEKLDERGYYSYSGCLEGRGFDECGHHGFNLLDVGKDGIKREFVRFAKREIFDISVDISGASDPYTMLADIRRSASEAGITEKDMVKIRLTGNISLDTYPDTEFISGSLSDEFYFVKVVDETRPFIDYESFAGDISLKGEYVRLVRNLEQSGEMDTKEAEECIALGVRLLMGEDTL